MNRQKNCCDLLLLLFGGVGLLVTIIWSVEPVPVDGQSIVSSIAARPLAPETIGLEVSQRADGGLQTTVLTPAENAALAEAATQHTAEGNELARLTLQTQDPESLMIKLRFQPGAANHAEAKAAFERAATRWATIVKAKRRTPGVPFEITVDLDFNTTAFGQAFATRMTVSKTQMTTTGLIPIAPWKEVFTREPVVHNYQYQKSVYEQAPTPIPTELGDSAGISWSSANGISEGAAFTLYNTYFHRVAFNSTLPYDFDASDGIDSNKLDFEALALREFARFLGFYSQVDLRQIVPAPLDGPTGPIVARLSIWDSYRFAPGISREELPIALRRQRAIGDHIFFTGDLEATMAVVPLSSSDCCIETRPTNVTTYNRASGHWKDDALTGDYLGIMDESFLPGERGGITALDVATLSYFLVGVAPATPVFEVLSADDNRPEQLLPASSALYVNRLTPGRAPAVLESVRVQLPPEAVGKQLRFVVFHDAQRTGQPPANPTLLLNRTLSVPALPAHGMLEVLLSTASPLPRGDVYVGVQAVNGDVRFAADTSAPRGRSFVSLTNGASFQPLTADGGAAANLLLRATVNAKFNTVGNRPPELHALSTDAAPANAPLRLTVYGKYFYPVSDDAAGLRYATSVRVNGQPQATEFLGASQLRAEIPASALASGTTARITIFTQTPAGGLESAPLTLNLTPNAPVPVLTRLAAPTVAVASGATPVTIYGRNLLPTTVVRVNGTPRATTLARDGQLTVTLTAADVAQAGTLNLTAFNAAPGGGTSNALPLAVAGCTYRLSATGRAYVPAPEGETLDGFVLDTQDHCPWTVTTSAPWVRLEGATSGVGRAPIGFAVLNNPVGGGRQATVNVGGQSFRVSQPSGLTVVSAANYAPLTAAGAIATIFGTELATTTQAANTTPLPTTLAGTRVTVQAGTTQYPCPLFLVSPTQINFYLPPEPLLIPPAGDPRTYTLGVSVFVNEVLVASGTLIHADVAPSLFTANAAGTGAPAGVALRVKADGTQQYEPLVEWDATQQRYVARAIKLGVAGERVYAVLFGTGFRRRTSLEQVVASAGNVQLPVTFAGAQGTLIGVDQLNVELDAQALAGRSDVTLQLIVDNRRANAVTLRVQSP